MKKLITFLHENGTYAVAISTLAVGFCIQYVLIAHFLPAFLDHAGGLKNPDQLLSYSAAYLEELYGMLGVEGRAFYAQMLSVDFGYATISGVGYSLLLAALSKQRKWFILLPLMTTLFDVAENTLQLILMRQYPMLSPTGVTVASVLTSAKMITGMVVLLLIMYWVGANVVRWARSVWG
ncbi:hypothetical protein [Pontibacter sp. G13]|uniref:hypothetical protein n=1 Tax=Pontibacter sp. G13 TaxID=3074898 RepID=UPI00288B5A22|nr:hypothetical protein [Pontibacter sp. G13]WNJ18269.1 hypothetical protein RJD25_25740 [Pontibacter sp. G13]